MLIAIPSLDWKAGPYYVWGYAVGVLSAVVCLTSTFLGLQGVAKLQNKSSFAALILGYESIAAIFRALLLLTSAPVGWGFAFYNGLGTNTLNHMSTIMGPLGLPTTVLTALVWVKFTAFRSNPPMVADVMIAFVSVVITALSCSVIIWVYL